MILKFKLIYLQTDAFRQSIQCAKSAYRDQKAHLLPSDLGSQFTYAFLTDFKLSWVAQNTQLILRQISKLLARLQRRKLPYMVICHSN